jgi:hypothetical protein
MRSMNWFYSPDGTQRHEVSDEALAGLARDGKLTGEMLLWREGLTEWRPARDVRPELFAPAGSALPPPPPPPDAAPAAPPVFAPPSPAASMPYYQPVPPQRPTNASALTSVISGGIGLVSATTSFCCCLGVIVSPVAGLVAVIFGHMAYSAAKGYTVAENDKNMALVGLICGYLTLAITVGYILYLVLVVGVAGMAAMAEGMKGGSFTP